MGWFIEGHRYGNWIFAVRTSGKKKGKWQVMATVANRLRKSLEEFAHYEFLHKCVETQVLRNNAGRAIWG